MRVDLDDSWRGLLADELEKSYFKDLGTFVDAARATGNVYPREENVFAAFTTTPFNHVKVVLLGQDPYHEPGQAQGLAFYVPEGIRTPPSLRNIAKELAAEYPERAPGVPDLRSWAAQGVLLLNATLTVAEGDPLSHRNHGWETFTDAIITKLSAVRENLVFVLWGSHAQKKGAQIDRARHLVLESAHPSPLSARRGFFGCNHFRLCNDYLAAKGLGTIRW